MNTGNALVLSRSRSEDLESLRLGRRPAAGASPVHGNGVGPENGLGALEKHSDKHGFLGSRSNPVVIAVMGSYKTLLRLTAGEYICGDGRAVRRTCRVFLAARLGRR